MGNFRGDWLRYKRRGLPGAKTYTRTGLLFKGYVPRPLRRHRPRKTNTASPSMPETVSSSEPTVPVITIRISPPKKTPFDKEGEELAILWDQETALANAEARLEALSENLETERRELEAKKRKRAPGRYNYHASIINLPAVMETRKKIRDRRSQDGDKTVSVLPPPPLVMVPKCMSNLSWYQVDHLTRNGFPASNFVTTM